MKIKTKFAKFLIIYVTILIVPMIVFLIYVADSLIKYEQYQESNYIQAILAEIKEGKKSDIKNIKLGEFENNGEDAKKGIAQKLRTSTIALKKDNDSSEKKPIYSIYEDNNVILRIELKELKEENRLKLLTFSKWGVENIEVTENGLYDYVISAPNNYKVFINNIKLGEKYIISKDEQLTQISKYIDVPYIVKYKVSNLYKIPEFKILDADDKEVKAEIGENTVSVDIKSEKIAKEEDLGNKIKNKPDVMKIAEQWSLYLTDDLSGNQHGFNTISQYLIKDSDLYNFAKKWATGVDIKFVSSHRLENPIFTNKSISNFEIYSEDAFSCEVYLQKNLRLVTGKKIEDKMHERMYFANVKNGNNKSWKLVNMQSIKGNES